jgi:hypothetical protein
MGTAERALKEALRDRNRVTPDGEITPETRVRAVAELWWQDFVSRGTAAGTLRLYRGRLDLHVRSSVKADIKLESPRQEILFDLDDRGLGR